AGTFRCAARSPCSRPEGGHRHQEGRVRRSRPMRPVCRAVQPPPGFDCPLGARQLWSAASRRFAQSLVAALTLWLFGMLLALLVAAATAATLIALGLSAALVALLELIGASRSASAKV